MSELGSDFGPEDSPSLDDVGEHLADAASSLIDALDSAVDFALDRADALVTDGLGPTAGISVGTDDTPVTESPYIDPLLGGVEHRVDAPPPTQPEGASGMVDPLAAAPPTAPPSMPTTPSDGATPDSGTDLPNAAGSNPITGPDTELNVFNDADVGRLLEWKPSQDEMESLTAEVFPGASEETIEELASVPTDPQEVQEEQQKWNGTAQGFLSADMKSP